MSETIYVIHCTRFYSKLANDTKVHLSLHITPTLSAAPGDGDREKILPWKRAISDVHVYRLSDLAKLTTVKVDSVDPLNVDAIKAEVKERIERADPLTFAFDEDTEDGDAAKQGISENPSARAEILSLHGLPYPIPQRLQVCLTVSAETTGFEGASYIAIPVYEGLDAPTLTPDGTRVNVAYGTVATAVVQTSTPNPDSAKAEFGIDVLTQLLIEPDKWVGLNENQMARLELRAADWFDPCERLINFVAQSSRPITPELLLMLRKLFVACLRDLASCGCQARADGRTILDDAIVTLDNSEELALHRLNLELACRVYEQVQFGSAKADDDRGLLAWCDFVSSTGLIPEFGEISKKISNKELTSSADVVAEISLWRKLMAAFAEPETTTRLVHAQWREAVKILANPETKLVNPLRLELWLNPNLIRTIKKADFVRPVNSELRYEGTTYDNTKAIEVVDAALKLDGSVAQLYEVGNHEGRVVIRLSGGNLGEFGWVNSPGSKLTTWFSKMSDELLSGLRQANVRSQLQRSLLARSWPLILKDIDAFRDEVRNWFMVRLQWELPTYWPFVSVGSDYEYVQTLLGDSLKHASLPFIQTEPTKATTGITLSLNSPKDSSAIDDEAGILQEIAGLGCLVRRAGGKWRCMNLTDMHVKGEASGFLTVGAEPIGANSGQGGVSLTYLNDSTFADKILSALARPDAEDQSVGMGTPGKKTEDSLLIFGVSPTDERAKCPTLCFGMGYEFFPFVVRHGGVLPQMLRGDHPCKLLPAEELAALDVGNSIGVHYVRTVSVGAPEPRIKNRSEVFFEKGKIDNVFPLAWDLPRDKYATDSPEDEAAAKEKPIMLLHRKLANVKLAFEPPKTDYWTWDGWIAKEFYDAKDPDEFDALKKIRERTLLKNDRYTLHDLAVEQVIVTATPIFADTTKPIVKLFPVVRKKEADAHGLNNVEFSISLGDLADLEDEFSLPEGSVWDFEVSSGIRADLVWSRFSNSANAPGTPDRFPWERAMDRAVEVTDETTGETTSYARFSGYRFLVEVAKELPRAIPLPVPQSKLEGHRISVVLPACDWSDLWLVSHAHTIGQRCPLEGLPLKIDRKSLLSGDVALMREWERTEGFVNHPLGVSGLLDNESVGNIPMIRQVGYLDGRAPTVLATFDLTGDNCSHYFRFSTSLVGRYHGLGDEYAGRQQDERFHTAPKAIWRHMCDPLLVPCAPEVECRPPAIAFVIPVSRMLGSESFPTYDGDQPLPCQLAVLRNGYHASGLYEYYRGRCRTVRTKGDKPQTLFNAGYDPTLRGDVLPANHNPPTGSINVHVSPQIGMSFDSFGDSKRFTGAAFLIGLEGLEEDCFADIEFQKTILTVTQESAVGLAEMESIWSAPHQCLTIGPDSTIRSFSVKELAAQIKDNRLRVTRNGAPVPSLTELQKFKVPVNGAEIVDHGRFVIALAFQQLGSRRGGLVYRGFWMPQPDGTFSPFNGSENVGSGWEGELYLTEMEWAGQFKRNDSSAMTIEDFLSPTTKFEDFLELAFPTPIDGQDPQDAKMRIIRVCQPISLRAPITWL